MGNVIKLSTEIACQIERVIPNLEKALISRRKCQKRQKIGQIAFTDPHSGLIRTATVSTDDCLSRKSGETTYAVCEQKESGNADIVFYRCQDFWRQAKASRMLRFYLRNNLIHEMTHVLDPRPWEIQGLSHNRRFIKRKAHWLDYYTDSTEFDAFCGEIVALAEKELRTGKKHLRRRWETLLRKSIDSTNHFFYKIFLGHTHREAIQAWIVSDQERNTSCMRQFRIRLYKSLEPWLSSQPLV